MHMLRQEAFPAQRGEAGVHIPLMISGSLGCRLSVLSLGRLNVYLLAWYRANFLCLQFR